MEQTHARYLLPFVNKKENTESLSYYATVRIGQLQKELETAELTTVSVLQGQLKELRKLLELEVLVKSKAV